MFEFDESRRPLYVVHLRGSATSEDVDALEHHVMGMLRRAESYALLWDLSQAEFPHRSQVSRTMAVSKQMRLVSAELYDQANPPVPAFAAYFLNPRMAKLVDFINRMMPKSDVETAVFSSYAEALRACERMLEGFGVRVPPASRPTG